MKRRFGSGAVVIMLTGLLVSAGAEAAASPSVVTGAHGTITQTSAVLEGAVNPNGAATRYYFRWGTSSAYGANGAVRSAGRGTNPVAAAVTASGLVPGTTYHYQLVAANRYGTAVGADRTFTTAGHPPPEAATGPVSQLGSTYVTLTGLVNPRGEQTIWQFQYGTTPFYGSSTFGGTTAPGTTPAAVSSPLQGLSPATIFHYRLVAQHPGSAIVVYGADQIFMTYPSPPPTPTTRAHTAPHRKRQHPFLFTTSGRVAGPSWIPQPYACSGEVTIRSFFGPRQVGYTVAPVQPNCTFAGQTEFTRKPGRGSKNRRVRLNVFIHFLGTGYLAPARARPETIVLG